MGVTAVVVLAAGAGTRMRSTLPKVMHPLAGRPLLWHALTAARGLAPEHLVAVVGHGRETVGAWLETNLPDVATAVQDEQLGTGHAVSCALDVLGPLTGTVVVTYGDVPLLRTETLAALVSAHQAAGNAVTVLTAHVTDPTGYGRIVRDAPDGGVSAIVEHKDADAAQRAITEINSGVYAFDAAVLADALTRITAANAQGERYLTDVVGIARGDGRPVGGLVAEDAAETEGVNDRVQLSDMARTLNDRLVRSAQLAGATVLDPRTTWLHADVVVAADATIARNTSLEAGTTVAAGATVGPDTTLVDCRVGVGATVVRTHAQGAVIGDGAAVGPFTFLRPGTVLAAGAKVGAYVEVKKSTIGPGAKVPHLSYVGDATLGAGVNFGAGAITANYDGVGKYDTVIGDGAFVGTNTTLVAPVTVEPGGFTAAGSTITDDVAAGDLAVARGRQSAVPGWVARRLPGSTMAAAAERAADTTSHHPATPSAGPAAIPELPGPLTTEPGKASPA
ncbi:bifunctional UDP-N-acetylglucosamine diphosphorylase/glucosamine-1-phosphate N-acetyltransferase GlmU [Nakamurella deserti]|uniref:bifunctional UDP-N-acetylglucosamine diphosphorylase/glucosamine-1-phosphate N-acetyltransferase GlmU n=1 Tax=Nakamurella deserti TaxID=2164074 RepID=UPI000DBE70DB|nr:bifunctional UDP-N-acetylglucosamine diphosphorylase/glucosamine-1-phosphate N-acetyltransferase GlmU [Nakamurella deserti]